MSTGKRLRKHSRVNHLLQHSRHVICCRHLELHTARLFYQVVTQRVNRRTGHTVAMFFTLHSASTSKPPQSENPAYCDPFFWPFFVPLRYRKQGPSQHKPAIKLPWWTSLPCLHPFFWTRQHPPTLRQVVCLLVTLSNRGQGKETTRLSKRRKTRNGRPRCNLCPQQRRVSLGICLDEVGSKASV